MQNQVVKFLSITKFVDFMNLKFTNIKGATIYFEGADMFKNKFGKLCIKPVMLKLSKGLTTEKDEYIKHQKILDLFEAQPILSFGEGKTRWMVKDKTDLYYLLVDFKIKEWNNFKFYPSEMFKCHVEKNIKIVRDNEVHFEPTITDQEEEISPDEF